MIERHRLLAAQAAAMTPAYAVRTTHNDGSVLVEVMSDPTPTMFAVGMSEVIADAICGTYAESAASLRADLDVGFLRHLVAGMERHDGIVGTYWCSKPDWSRPTRSQLLGLRCLTVKQPWAAHIVYGGKRVENRVWHAPRSIVGTRIGIHAGLGVDRNAPPHDSGCHSALIGTAVVVASVEACPPGQEDWWIGPHGWVLDDVVELAEPIPMRGQLGVWRITEGHIG